MQNSIKGRVTSNISQIPFYKDVENKTANIQPQSDGIYGELSEKVIRPVYEAVDTSTLDLTIDNETKTIKGDVLFKDFTGETSDKAYPGHLGKRNYELILSVRDDVNSLASKYNIFKINVTTELNVFKNELETFEKSLTEQLDNTNTYFTKEISNLSKKLKTLEQELTDVDNELLSKLVEETTERIDSIKQLQKNINEETAKRVSAINAVTLLIQNEIDRATSKENNLQTQIDDLEHVVESLESEIFSKLDPKLQELDDKIERIQSETLTEIDKKLDTVDKTLQEEVVRATTAETELAQSILEETNRATAAENDILEQSKKYTDETKDAILGDGIKETFDTLTEIQNWIETEGIDTVELTEAIAQEAAIRDTSDKDLLLKIEQEATSRQSDDDLIREDIQNIIGTEEDTLETMTLYGNRAYTDSVSKEVTDVIKEDLSKLDAKDTELKTSIDKNTTDITDEVTRATAAEQQLEEKINTVNDIFTELQFIDGGTAPLV